MSAPQTTEQLPGEGRYAVWNLFNEKAKVRDKELLKDWSNNISSLLLFAAIFASVLISLCVETRKLLEQDPLDVIQKTIVYMAERDRNASTLPPSLAFTPEPWAVAVNAYFFGSLTVSILAALGAVMSLQWVAEYDAGLDAASTPKQRALRVHYRYRATKQWYMHQIIAALPIILYISLALFFVGLAVWFQHVYPALAIIPLVGLLIGAVGYLITAAFTIFYPSAPFRTSMSRLLFRVTWLAHFYIWYTIQTIRLLRVPFTNFIIGTGKELWLAVCSIFSNTPLDVKFGERKYREYKDKFDVTRANFKREMKVKRIQAYPWMRAGRYFWHSMQARVWERYNVTQDRSLHISALSWLANRVHLSAHSQDDFRKLLKELNSVEDFRLQEWPQHDRDAPWGNIFSVVLSTKGIPTQPVSKNAAIPPEVPTAYSRLIASLSAKEGTDYRPSIPPNTSKPEKMITVVAQLIRKMSIFPELFERTLSGMNPTVVVAFMDDLVAHPPYDARQAKSRMNSLATLFSSRRWERLDAHIQVRPSTFNVILRCLQRMDTSPSDIFIPWLFTLCSVDPDASRVPWPDPESVSTFLNAFEHQELRRRGVQYYIDYVDCIFAGEKLPTTENRRWRWHGMKGKPSEECQIAMLQILAEHLMGILNPDAIEEISKEYATTARSPAIRIIMEAYHRSPSSLTPENVVDPQIMKDLNPISSYAAAFALGLRTRASQDAGKSAAPQLHEDAKDVMIYMVNAKVPTLNEMIDEFIREDIELTTADHWIAILESLLGSSNDEAKNKALDKYVTLMIELRPVEWLRVYHYFYSTPLTDRRDAVLPRLFSTLEDHLPHQIAQRRWRVAADRILIAQPETIFDFRRLVDVVWKRSQPNIEGGSLVKSPIPLLLDRMIWNLREIRQAADANQSQLSGCISILNVLVAGFVLARSVDRVFASRFTEIRREFDRIHALQTPPAGAQRIDVEAFDELSKLLASSHMSRTSI